MSPSDRIYPDYVKLAVTVVISILILLAGVPGVQPAAGAVGAGSASSGVHAGATADAGADGVDVAVTRVDGVVRYELTVRPGTDVNRLWLVVGGARLVEASGFDRSRVDGRTRLTWTGAASARAVLAVRAAPEGAADGPGGRESVATAAWTFAPVPFVELQRTVDGALERSWPLTERAGNLADARGVHGDRYALTGDADVVTRSANGRRVAVVVPEGATPREDPAAVAEALAAAARQLDVGDHDRAVLAYAVPGVRRGGESVPARDEFWVNSEARLDDPENVWLHEYVHTRQSFRLAPEMRWFREASAEYYAARLSHEQGTVSKRAYRRHVDGGPSRATLTDPGTWDGDDVPHDKGARVLAVLDAKVRAETDGRRSLEDVFRRLNGRDGRVTYAVFAGTVSEVAGAPMDAWLDRHVDGAAPVAGQYAAGTGPLAGGAALDPSPAFAFFFAAVGFSLAAAVPLYRVFRRRDRRIREGGDRERETPGPR
jgi:hypothetical protein